jgi:hypothetical protein
MVSLGYITEKRTARSWVLLVKLVVSHEFRNSRAFYGTGNFIRAFITARHWPDEYSLHPPIYTYVFPVASFLQGLTTKLRVHTWPSIRICLQRRAVLHQQHGVSVLANSYCDTHTDHRDWCRRKALDTFSRDVWFESRQRRLSDSSKFIGVKIAQSV